MYLSRLYLDTKRRGTRNLLSSPQRLHAALEGACNPDRQERRVLWRLDGHQPLELLVVSKHRPDFSDLQQQAGSPDGGWETTSYVRFLESLKGGQRVRFRLAANPVRNVRSDAAIPGKGLPRGKRVPIVGIANLEGWFTTRAPNWGLAVSEGEFWVANKSTASFRRRNPDNAEHFNQVQLSKIRYDGEATVTDPEALKTSLQTGVGSGKAYGCGLLTVAPV